MSRDFKATPTVNGSALALVSDLAAYVTKALYDANTILAANSDDTPAALTVAEDRIVGRITGGNIAALTAAQVRTLLGVTTTKTVRVPHTFALNGTGVIDTLPGFYISLPSGQTANIVAARYATTSGTATVSVRKNGSATPDLTGLSVSSTAATADESPDVSLADNDYIDLDITAVSSPVDLRVTVWVEYTV